MGYLTLIILTGLLFIFLKKKIKNDSLRLNNDYEIIRKGYEELMLSDLSIREKNESLKRSLEEIITLYDITKDICKYLDEKKVFESFINHIKKHVNLKDCRFFSSGEDLNNYKDYTLLSLEIDKELFGYLAYSGIEEGQEEIFNILAQQFILGIKRVVLYHRVEELTIIDSLTGVLNRRYWLERFTQEIARSNKFKLNFSFLMIDIDYFKNVNDQYGHLVGDGVIKEVAKRIKDNTRQIDLIARYGGEEFAVILIETDKIKAQAAAERIRQSVEEKEIKVYDEVLKISISIGISLFPADGDKKDVLVEKADSALYRVKQSGRNRVCVFGE
ncbi:MAG: GGDEF domain-containing protein [Candidatus Omnitrophota bacterium]